MTKTKKTATQPKRMFAVACTAAMVWSAGCKDEPSNGPGDAAIDAPADAGDAGGSAYPAIRTVPLSGLGADQLHAAAWMLDGSHFYASGLSDAASAAVGNRETLVARFLPTGELDTSWGQGGSVRIDVSGANGGKVEIGRSIAVQASGKIVVAGVVEHDVNATGALASDADVFVLRLHANGTLDDTFGDGGMRILNLNDGIPNGANTATTGADSLWNISLFSDGAILVHANQRAVGTFDDDMDGGAVTPEVPRTDNDWVALKLTADGDLDTTWAATSPTPGKFTLDLGLRESGTARTGAVLAGDRVLGGGYTTPSGAPQRPVLFMLDATGTLDATFNGTGVFNQTDILSQAAEAYGAAPHGTGFVTAGYGRDIGDPSPRWLSFRIGATGVLDPGYGTMGTTYPRFKGTVFGNGGNARSVLVLPSLEVLMVGQGGESVAPTTLADGGPGPTTQNDGAVARLSALGQLDTTFGTGGYLRIDFGGPSDALFASEYSLSPASTGECSRRVALVGFRGFGATQTDAVNDEAGVAVLCVP